MSIEPGRVFSRLTLARVLWQLTRRDDAIAAASAALPLATSDEERKEAQRLIDFFAANK